MLFRYASFKLINPMRVSGHYPCTNQKNEWHCHIRRFPYCFFFQRGEDEFHFNRRIKNACLKLSPVYAVNLCHCFVDYQSNCSAKQR